MPQTLFKIGDKARIDTPWDHPLHGTTGMIVDSVYNETGLDKGSICFTIQLKDRLVRIDQRFIRALPSEIRRKRKKPISSWRCFWSKVIKRS